MLRNKFIFTAGLLALVGCQKSEEYTSTYQARQATVTEQQAEETVAEDYFSEDQMKDVVASTSTPVPTTPAPAVPAPAPAAPAMTMEEAVTQTIAQSNLTPAQQEALNEKVGALMVAAQAGNTAQMTVAANQLTNFAVGIKSPIGFGLVDVAAAVAAVQDLIAAIMDLDVAGIIDAIMDLIAAIGA